MKRCPGKIHEAFLLIKVLQDNCELCRNDNKEALKSAHAKFVDFEYELQKKYDNKSPWM